MRVCDTIRTTVSLKGGFVTKSVFDVYRKANSTMAMWRDECICPMCGGVADESDHVFGRGHPTILLLEHWMLRMSICQLCHHKKHHGGGFDKVDQARRLKKANRAFYGEELELCYSALNQNVALEMIADSGKAMVFLIDWLAKNG